jgi:RNA polymerase sigma factor (sigma-70 family)
VTRFWKGYAENLKFFFGGSPGQFEKRPSRACLLEVMFQDLEFFETVVTFRSTTLPKGEQVARMARVSDEEILRWISEGGESEEKALRMIYKVHFPMVRQHIIHNKGSEDESYDVFQDTVLDFTVHVKQGRMKQSNIGAYLMGIVRYKWLNLLRRKGYGDQYSTEMKWLQRDDQEMAPDVPDQAKLDKDREAAVAHLFSQLGEKCIQILRLRFWDLMSMEKISDVMQYKSSQIAKNKHFRCMEELRELLSKNMELRNYLRGLL